MFPAFNRSSQNRATGVNAPLDDQGHTALHIAAGKGDMATVQRLLRIGAHIDQTDKNGQTPLFAAAAQGQAEMVAFLTEKHAKKSHRDQMGRTAVEWAIENGATPAFLEHLAQYGFDFAAAPKTRRTPLHLAASLGRDDLIAPLAARGLDINARDSDGKTPLHLATTGGHLDTMRLLVAAGANAAARDNDIITPLYIAAEKGALDAVDYLLTLPEVRTGINQHANYQNGFTPVMAAAAKNHVAVIDKLAALGADLNKTDNRNRHSLFIAVEAGQTDAVRKLIALGADVGKDVLSNNNKSPMIHWIEENNYREILTLLIQAGANINATDSNGQTALHRACDYMRRDKILPLLQMGAEVNGLNNYGQRPIDEFVDNYSYRNDDAPEIIDALLSAGADPGLSPSPLVMRAPLHVAVESGHMQSTRLLLEKGAAVDVTERSSRQQTPLHMAASNGNSDLGALLLAHGANPQKIDTDGWNALHHAAHGGNERFINLLLDKTEVDINSRDKSGATPLHHACANEKRLAIAALISRGADINAMDDEGLNPLHRAMAEGSDDAVDAYVQTLGAKADYDVLSRAGETPLMYAIKRGIERSVHKLLAAGADVTVQGRNGDSALHTALLDNKASLAMILAEELQKRGINPDILRNKDGHTPLHMAAMADTVGVAEKLIEAGADIHQPDENGETPLHVAARMQNTGMTIFLLQSGAKALVPNKNGETPMDIVMAANHNYLFDIMLPAAIEEEQAQKPPQGTAGTPKPPPQGPRPPAP